MEGQFTRRAFLVSTASVAIGVMAPIALAQPAAALAGDAAASKLRRSTYTPLLGCAFRMANGRTSVPVVLAKIGDLQPLQQPDDENRFSLVFAASHHQPVGQGVYTLVSPALSVALFVVPVGPPATAQRYLAIVNRA